jgi:ankyrin repeat protein
MLQCYIFPALRNISMDWVTHKLMMQNCQLLGKRVFSSSRIKSSSDSEIPLSMQTGPMSFLSFRDVKAYTFALLDDSSKYLQSASDKLPRIIPESTWNDNTKRSVFLESVQHGDIILISKSVIQKQADALLEDKSMSSRTPLLLAQPESSLSLSHDSASLINMVEKIVPIPMQTLASALSRNTKQKISVQIAKRNELHQVLSKLELNLFEAVQKGSHELLQQILSNAQLQHHDQSLNQSDSVGENFYAIKRQNSANNHAYKSAYVHAQVEKSTSVSEFQSHDESVLTDINCRNQSGATALHFAAMFGHSNIVRTLIEYGASVNACADNGSTPLHWAAGSGHTDTVLMLLQHGADATLRSTTWNSSVFGKGSGQTPSHWAAESGHVDIVKLLHLHAPDSSVTPDDKDQTPICLAKKELRSATVTLLQQILNEEYIGLIVNVQHANNAVIQSTSDFSTIRKLH